MFRMTLALFLLLFLQRAFADPNAPCYFPIGRPAPGYFACDTTAYITQCCPKGWTCYSNNLCVVTDPSEANSTNPIGTTIRATCTDPKWKNAVCGDFCLVRSRFFLFKAQTLTGLRTTQTPTEGLKLAEIIYSVAPMIKHRGNVTARIVTARFLSAPA